MAGKRRPPPSRFDDFLNFLVGGRWNMYGFRYESDPKWFWIIVGILVVIGIINRVMGWQ